jgi:hypothetical protein
MERCWLWVDTDVWTDPETGAQSYPIAARFAAMANFSGVRRDHRRGGVALLRHARLDHGLGWR